MHFCYPGLLHFLPYPVPGFVVRHVEPSNSNVGQFINKKPRAAGIKYHAGTRIDMPFTECWDEFLTKWINFCGQSMKPHYVQIISQ